MNEQYPHKGEEWMHKDGSGLVTIDVMFENNIFYTRRGHKWTCNTKRFKKLYIKKDVLMTLCNTCEHFDGRHCDNKHAIKKIRSNYYSIDDKGNYIKCDDEE